MSKNAHERITLDRVLDRNPVLTLDDYVTGRGGLGLAEAVQSSGQDVIAALHESGLHGRGGAGFPTGIKWRTIAEHGSGILPATVIVNAAEGELPAPDSGGTAPTSNEIDV